MADLKQLFKTAVASSMDLRGKPAILGKIDGTLYWSSTRRDMIWARVGESNSNQEMVVHCTKVTPQVDLPVRVDMVNGIMSVVAVDEKRYLEFSGNRPGGSVGAHAWLHGRLGPDPLYVTGLQYLPLLVRPTNPADLTVTVEQGAYRWDGTYKIFERAATGSLSAYVPGSSSIKHFVIICLDRENNTLVIVDGDDLTGGDDALFGGIVLTPADITAVSIDDAYLPLAAIVLYNGQTEVRAADIMMDLRTWGGEDFVGAASGIPEPDDDGETYGRKTDGTSSWVAVVPKGGGEFTGAVEFSGNVGFYGTSPVSQPTAVSSSTALETLGLGATLIDEIPEPSNDSVTYGRRVASGTPSWVAVVPQAGGIYSGAVTISLAGTDYLILNSPADASSTPAVQFSRNGNTRWLIRQGSFTNNSLTFRRYDASGVFQDTPIYLDAVAGYVGVRGIPSSSNVIDGGVVFNEPGADVDHRIEGDTDANLTYWDAGNNRVGIGTATPTDKLHVVGSTSLDGAAVFNETGADVDFRFETDTDANALFIDGGLNSIGMGTNTPTAFLHLAKTVTATTPIPGLFVNNIFAPGSAPGTVFPIALNLQAEYNSSQNASGFQLAQFLDVRNSGNGTISARNLDIVYRNLGTGTIARVDDIYIRTPINSGGGAITTAHGIYIEAQTVAGTNYAIYTNAGQLRFGDGATFGSPTGGYKGSGTVNAQAVYDDNVLLTDHILDLYYDGKMSKADKKKYPHARLWSIEETAVFAKANRHLPTMPGRETWLSSGPRSVGELVTHLWETVEQQQLQIFELNDRLKAVANG